MRTDNGKTGAANTPLAVTIDHAAEALGVSRATIYRLAGRGELRLVKLGAATRVPVAELERLAGGEAV